MSALLLLQGAMTAVIFNFTSLGTALASPSTPNSLGTVFAVVSKGPTSTIEITLHPTAPFDSVKVEAGSGVATLTPPCAFSRVATGGNYVCRVNVTQAAQDASLSLNVIGQRIADPAKPPIVEISHFTISNDSFVEPAATKPRTMGPAMTHKPDTSTR